MSTSCKRAVPVLSIKRRHVTPAVVQIRVVRLTSYGSLYMSRERDKSLFLT